MLKDLRIIRTCFSTYYSRNSNTLAEYFRNNLYLSCTYCHCRCRCRCSFVVDIYNIQYLKSTIKGKKQKGSRVWDSRLTVSAVAVYDNNLGLSHGDGRGLTERHLWLVRCAFGQTRSAIGQTRAQFTIRCAFGQMPRVWCAAHLTKCADWSNAPYISRYNPVR